MLKLLPDLVLELLAGFLSPEHLGRLTIGFRRVWALPLDSTWERHGYAMYGFTWHMPMSQTARVMYCKLRNADRKTVSLLRAPPTTQSAAFRSMFDSAERQRAIMCLLREEQKSEDLRARGTSSMIFSDTRWRMELMMVEIVRIANAYIRADTNPSVAMNMATIISMIEQCLKIDYAQVVTKIKRNDENDQESDENDENDDENGEPDGEIGENDEDVTENDDLDEDVAANEDNDAVEARRHVREEEVTYLRDVARSKALAGFDYVRDEVYGYVNHLSGNIRSVLRQQGLYPYNVSSKPGALERIMETIRVELFKKVGFHGGPSAYSETGGSDVLQVLENPRKRSALPITLCMMYVCVWHCLCMGQWVSWCAEGGHFFAVVRSRFGKESDKDYYVDCYHGGRIDRIVHVGAGASREHPPLVEVYYRQLHNYANQLVKQLFLVEDLNASSEPVLELFFQARTMDCCLHVFEEYGLPEFPCFYVLRELFEGV